MKNSMKAIGYQHNLPIEDKKALQDIELDVPKTQGHDILVAVKAISVNPVDTKVRHGMAPENGGYKVLGWDAAGLVKAVGEALTGFKADDKVWYASDLTRRAVMLNLCSPVPCSKRLIWLSSTKKG